MKQQRKVVTSDGVVVLGGSKEDAVGFQDLPAEGLDRRREPAVGFEVRVYHRERRYVDHLDSHPVPRLLLGYLDRCTPSTGKRELNTFR